MPSIQSTPNALLDAVLEALADKIAARITPKPVETEYLTPAQAAQLLGFEVNTLEIWRTRGRGPKFFKIGRNTVRYRRADVIAWMERDERVSTSAPVRRRK